MIADARILLAIIFCSSLALTGCGGDSASNASATRSDNSTSASNASPGSETKQPPEADTTSATTPPPESDTLFVLGDLIEPFTPPATLEEIESAHSWDDRDVVDSLAALRAEQAEEPAPELTPEEALALRNDSREDNEKIAAALGRVPAAGSDEVDFDAEIVRIAQGDLKSTNPLLLSSTVEFDYNGLTGVGLFSFDRHLNNFAAHETVVSWKSNKDRTIDVVKMRDDLTWSDGKPITAHDVEFTFRLIMSSAVVIPAVRQGVDQLQLVKAYDDHTVVFFHKEALSTNIGNMNFPIVPKHIYASSVPEDPTMARSSIHQQQEDQPVVGGAYNLVRRERGQEFVLERRESYYMHQGKQVREKPHFKTVRFKVIEDPNTALLALKAGDVQEQFLRAEQWHAQTNDDGFYEKNTKVSGVEWVAFHYCWNLETPYFEDKRVRQAMSWAVDYEELLGTICHGLYDHGLGPFHPQSWMFPSSGIEAYQQDLDRAEDLLDAAGWDDEDNDGIRDKRIDGKLVPFEFTLLCANVDSSIKVATVLRESLDRIGIVCNVKPTEFTVLVQLNRDHKFQATVGGWGTGVDPDTASNIWVTGEGRNYGSYSNPEVDRLFEQGRRTFDRDERAKIYAKIHTLLWEDQPYTWLYYRNSFYGFSKKLRGYTFSPRGPFHYGPGFSAIYMP